ncbi:MAG: 2Fe-2S iron-sulfur cluster binding domain-containing protein [Pseudomonadota bacterium]|nr:2Fe-2S iron-sulfur cluster binding domain-containing protein [Pseudomonadota bacterium]
MIKGLFGKAREPGTVTVEPLGREVAVAKSQSILQAALDQGIEFPHSCKVGTCTQCRCLLLDGEIKQIRDFSYVLSAEEIREGYILACQSRVKPGTRVRLRVQADVGAPRHQRLTTDGTIVGQRLLTHDIVELRVQVAQALEYTAGQYASLARDETSRPRDYSFANPPAPQGRTDLTFYIRKVPGGEFTEWLFSTDRSGETLTVTGPAGDFWLRQGTAPLLLVAGGSGLAPILALLKDASARKVARDAVLLFGARQQRDLYCLDDIETMVDQWPADFRFIPVLSEEPASSGWAGARGLVTEQIGSQMLGSLAKYHAYLCGPPAMIDAAMVLLVGGGIPVSHIHYDKFLDASNLPDASVQSGGG